MVIVSLSCDLNFIDWSILSMFEDQMKNQVIKTYDMRDPFHLMFWQIITSFNDIFWQLFSTTTKIENNKRLKNEKKLLETRDIMTFFFGYIFLTSVLTIIFSKIHFTLFVCIKKTLQLFTNKKGGPVYSQANTEEPTQGELCLVERVDTVVYKLFI